MMVWFIQLNDNLVNFCRFKISTNTHMFVDKNLTFHPKSAAGRGDNGQSKRK